MTTLRTTLILITLALAASASGEDKVGKTAPLFTSNELLEVTIRAPFKTIMRERSEEEDVPGTLSYEDAETGEVTVEIGIQARGRYRRQSQICKWAPLRLNFKKSAVKETEFAGSDKLKLVTHCRNGSDRYTQPMLAEHLAYRILNQVTDASFRVRLLRITYVDSDRDDRENTELGFLIEHKEQVARRLGLETNDAQESRIEHLDARHTNLGSVYQYLIGNTDFSPIKAPPGEPCCHNYMLFGAEEGRIFSIPYDFDMSGIVDAPYAAPNARFGLRNVRERLYRGRCANNAHLDTSIQAFRDRKAAIYDLVNSDPHLKSRSRKETLRYLDEFFDTIESPRRSKLRLTDQCLQ